MKPLRVLISAGPTREPIDPVRFLSNYSTGYMGSCLAREARRRGHRVTLVTGPTEIPPPRGARLVRVERAGQMRAALQRHMRAADVLIMAAAVCDYQPAQARPHKLPRRGRLVLFLKATPDIVSSLPRRRGQLVVGFALESARVLAKAKAKLRQKRLDLLVAQQLNGTSPFGEQAVRAWLLDAQGTVRRLGRMRKPQLATQLFDAIEQRRRSPAR